MTERDPLHGPLREPSSRIGGFRRRARIHGDA